MLASTRARAVLRPLRAMRVHLGRSWRPWLLATATASACGYLLSRPAPTPYESYLAEQRRLDPETDFVMTEEEFGVYERVTGRYQALRSKCDRLHCRYLQDSRDAAKRGSRPAMAFHLDSLDCRGMVAAEREMDKVIEDVLGRKYRHQRQQRKPADGAAPVMPPLTPAAAPVPPPPTPVASRSSSGSSSSPPWSLVLPPPF
jgi:hypothetical protein